MKFRSPITRYISRFLPALLLLAAASLIPAQAQTAAAPDSAASEMPDRLRWPADADQLPGKGAIQKWKGFPKMWNERRAEFWKNRAQDHGAVVFLGDSITQKWEDLAKAFPNLKIANRGISGDVTRGVLFRMKEDVLDLEPEAVVLLIGTNDLGNGGNPDDAAGNIRQIVAALEKSNPQMPIVVCKVMPRKKAFAERIEKLNSEVDALVKGDPRLIGCDTWSIYATGKGACKKEEFPDMLHPNESGYAKWIAQLQPIFARLDLETKPGS